MGRPAAFPVFAAPNLMPINRGNLTRGGSGSRETSDVWLGRNSHEFRYLLLYPKNALHA